MAPAPWTIIKKDNRVKRKGSVKYTKVSILNVSEKGRIWYGLRPDTAMFMTVYMYLATQTQCQKSV